MTAEHGPRAQSVTEAGEPDGWEPEPGWSAEVTPRGDTRLCVSVPHTLLPEVHLALLQALAEPLSVLYRQKVDRRTPRPQAAPPKDHVALELPTARVVAALREHGAVVWHDARAELWVRGGLNEQVVLDEDGLLFCYPDDPAFRDALEAVGVHGVDVQTMAERDYVKHWFHAEHDAHEDGLIATLGLANVPHR